MTGVAEGSVEGEELLEAIGDVCRGKKVFDPEILGLGVDKVDAGVVTDDVDVAVGVVLKRPARAGK